MEFCFACGCKAIMEAVLMDVEEVDENLVCGVCKLSSVSHPTLQLMTSTKCGHALCDACASRGFATASAVACPRCNAPIRRHHLVKSSVAPAAAATALSATAGPLAARRKAAGAAAPGVTGAPGPAAGGPVGAAAVEGDDSIAADYSSFAQEMKIRNKIVAEFNKRREDCASDREFNDYLERREQLVYNLLHDIDVEAAHEAIRVNRVENGALIARNQALRDAELAEVAARIEQEKREWLARRRLAMKADQDTAEEQRREEQMAVDGLAAGQSMDDVASERDRRRELQLLDRAKREAQLVRATGPGDRSSADAAGNTPAPAVPAARPVYVASSLVAGVASLSGQPTPIRGGGAAARRTRPVEAQKRAGGWLDRWIAERARCEAARCWNQPLLAGRGTPKHCSADASWFDGDGAMPPPPATLALWRHYMRPAS